MISTFRGDFYVSMTISAAQVWFTMQLLTFIFGLASLIFVHELGHFLAAKLLKVKSDEFGIGFPPRLFGTARDRSGKRRWFGMKTPEDKIGRAHV